MMREATALIFATVTSIVLFTYMLRLPFVLIPSHQEVVREYYYEKMIPNVWLDVIFIVLYLLPAIYLSRSLDTALQPIVVAGVTAILTSGFCFLFRQKPMDKENFFSKWFHTVGYASVMYDVILLVLTFVLYKFMLSSTNTTS
jgi:hypothetical protein